MEELLGSEDEILIIILIAVGLLVLMSVAIVLFFYFSRKKIIKTELEKLGAQVTITNDSLRLEASEIMNTDVLIATYKDHRMAMAFAPLGLKTSISIKIIHSWFLFRQIDIKLPENFSFETRIDAASGHWIFEG